MIFGRSLSFFALAFPLTLTLIVTAAWSLPSYASLMRSWKPKFENRLSVLPIYYGEDIGQNTSQWTTAISDEAAFSLKPTADLRLRLVPWFYSDPSSTSPSERFLGDVNEANASQRLGDFEFRLGVNQIAWGVTDVYNPLDVVSAHRYVDLLNSDKRGVPSLDLNWERDNWRLEAIYVPIQLESILPGENSRWLPRGITYSRGNSTGDRLILDPTFQYHYAERREFDDALKNNFGFRLERRGNGVDLSAVFFQGAPTAPSIDTPLIQGTVIGPGSGPNTATVQAQQVTLKPVYYLRRTVGASAVITLETAIIRIAAAGSERLTQKSSLPGWSQSGVIGVEKNFAVGSTTLTALLQATVAQHEDQADNMITSLDRIFDRSWLLGFRLPTSGAFSYSLAGLYDSFYQSGYIQFKTDYKVSDGWTASLQGDWIDGGEGSPLGTYRRNKRVILGFTGSY